MVYLGEFVEPEEAERIGLIDEVLPLEKVEGRAIEKIKELAMLPQRALSAIKATRVEGIKSKYEKNHKSKNEMFLDCWFSPPVQELLQKAAKKF